MEKDKIELKTIMETAEVADYLTALAKGFRAGRIVVEKDGEHLVLNPAAMTKAEVEIEARIKKDKAKFSLELSWLLAPELDECAEFKIGTELPKPPMTHEERCGDKKPAPAPDKPASHQPVHKPASQPVHKPASHQPAHKPASQPVHKPASHQPAHKPADTAAHKPVGSPAPVQAKSDVKPAAAPAAHEPGGKAAAAVTAQAKPKA